MTIIISWKIFYKEAENSLRYFTIKTCNFLGFSRFIRILSVDSFFVVNSLQIYQTTINTLYVSIGALFCEPLLSPHGPSKPVTVEEIENKPLCRKWCALLFRGLFDASKT